MKFRFTAFLAFFLVSVALAQSATPGSVTQTTVSTVTATAGSVTCVLSNTTPALPSGVHADCKSGGVNVLSMDTVVAPGTNGTAGSILLNGDSVTWIVNQIDASSAIKWQIAANGVAKSGTF